MRTKSIFNRQTARVCALVSTCCWSVNLPALPSDSLLIAEQALTSLPIKPVPILSGFSLSQPVTLTNNAMSKLSQQAEQHPQTPQSQQSSNTQQASESSATAADQRFIPSEEISEDLSVSFPVDI